MEMNKVVQGDTLEGMKSLPDAIFDLVITSPPYNLKNSTGNGMKCPSSEHLALM